MNSGEIVHADCPGGRPRERAWRLVQLRPGVKISYHSHSTKVSKNFAKIKVCEDRCVDPAKFKVYEDKKVYSLERF